MQSMQSDLAKSATLDVRGMWCTSCANALERVLLRQPGVLDAKVSFAAESAAVEWDPQRTSLDQFLPRAAKLGYQCSLEGEGHERRAHLASIKRDLVLRLVVASFFSMWVMLAQWTLYLAPRDALPQSLCYWFAVFACLSALPVMGYCAQPFFLAAWRTLRARAPGMDFLVAMGASASFMLSLWRLVHGDATVYFDSAAMIVTFLLGGRLLEITVRAKSADAVTKLLELPPQFARCVDAEGVQTLVLAKRVEPGQTIRVLPGEHVPLDGVVTRGRSSLDRSLLTGETAVETVGPGEVVEAGTLNGEGELLISVRCRWGERRVDLIARTVRQMLARKTASQAMAERFTRYLVPSVCVLSLLTLAIATARGLSLGAAIEHAVSVLVITCPCALGMAVPLALSAGVSRAARSGILFRDVEAIERAARVDLFFFDKTGTITEGRLRLAGFELASGVSEDELMLDAALAEEGSEHPIAKAICAIAARSSARQARSMGGSTRAVPGYGVEWTGDAGMSLLAGRREFLRERGVRVPDVTRECTAVHVARNGQWRGALFFQDTPREGAAHALARISAQGIRLAMLTGDQMAVALRVADAVGLGDFPIFASQSPESKAARIVREQRSGACAGFIVDGLNDAPALAAADFSVAVGGASPSSIAAASVVLVDGGIETLSTALALARRTQSAMRQNLAAAAIYNLLAIPLAVSGFVSPGFAAALMILSSLSVTFNASRLVIVRAIDTKRG
jgi:P-type Cu+ transporter